MDLNEITENQRITKENAHEMFDVIFAEYKKEVMAHRSFKIQFLISNLIYRIIPVFLEMLLLVIVLHCFNPVFAIVIAASTTIYAVVYRFLKGYFKKNPFGDILSFLFCICFTCISITGCTILFNRCPAVLQFVQSNFPVLMCSFAAFFFFLYGPNKAHLAESICARMFLKDLHTAMAMTIQEENPVDTKEEVVCTENATEK